MTPTRSAGFIHPAFLIPAGAALDDGDDAGTDQDDETDDGAAGAGDGAHDDATGSSADDAGTAGEGSEHAVRDAKVKALSDENAKWRRRVRELEEQVARTVPTTAEVETLRVEKEFYRVAAGRVTDLGAAFKLADQSKVRSDDDGTVVGVEEMVNKVIQNYPFLAADKDDEPTRRTTAVPDGPKEGGSPSNRRRTGKPTAPTSTLRKKFPALDRR